MKRKFAFLLALIECLVFFKVSFASETQWSDWSTEYPIGYSNIETKTQYSKRTKQTTTSTSSSLSGWMQDGSNGSWGSYGPWSDWMLYYDGSDKSDSRQTETRTVYRYYYFQCSACYDHHPYYGITCDTCRQSGTVAESSYKERWETMYPYDASSYYQTGVWGGNKQWVYFGEAWYGNLYFWDSSNVVSALQGRYRDRKWITTYNYYKWSDWSDWQDDAIAAASDAEVQTRQVYRYQLISQKPIISEERKYNGSVITIKSNIENTDIYYTTNGDNPTTESTLYTGEFIVSEPTTIKAAAVTQGMEISEVSEYFCDVDAGDLKYLAYDKDTGQITACDKTAAEITIPSEIEGIKITGIAPRAFDGCANLEKITFNNTLQSIGQYAFNNCTALREIKLIEGLTEISTGAFYGCASLESIFIPDSVSKIGTGILARANPNIKIRCYKDSYAHLYAIDNKINYEIVEVMPPVIAEEIKYSGAVITITVMDEQTKVYYTLDGADPTVLSREYEEPFVLTTPATIKAIAVIPSGLMSDIIEYVCDVDVGDLGCISFDVETGSITDCLSEAVKINVPKEIDGAEVKIVKTGAFDQCTVLESISLPETVEVIEQYAFNNCAALKTVELHEGITSIGAGAFYGCASLEKIFIPDSVTSIGALIFARGNADVTVICSKNSAAYQYAVNNEINIELVKPEQDIIYGDIDSDGKVLNSDLVLMCQMCAGYEGFTDEQRGAADVFRDENINSLDLTMLMQYLADWSGIILGEER